MHPLAKLDHQFIWHPFTQMRDWLKREPVVIVAGKGAVLRDVYGREYLDANSSIWTNLHGHNHPKINTAIQRQLKKVAHSSALGLANEPASLLAGKLIQAANAGIHVSRFTFHESCAKPPRKSQIANRKLEKVFFSDDGSTALEVALKLAYEFTRRTHAKPVGRAPAGPKLLSEGRSSRAAEPHYLSLEGAYHGDTVGAVSLGHIDLFHKSYSGLLFKTDKVMSPYCYRCPFNRAKPERTDAREYRQCNWECIGLVEKQFASQKQKGNPYAAFVFEPLIQGAAGMIAQPSGWLQRVTEIARGHGALLIADEVMTGLGRVGQASCLSPFSKVRDRLEACPTLFACQHEGVQPDFLCLAKGLTGGYLPMAATLTTQKVFDAFLGEYEEFKTFFHGHSYTANQLGAAAALASLEILQGNQSIRARQNLEESLRDELQTLWSLPNVGDVRQAGLIAGIELVRDWRTRKPFDLRERAGIRVCEAMARRGVLTRPVGNVIVLMPPYCTTPVQVRKMVRAVSDSVREVFGRRQVVTTRELIP
jgi:adenosylmethionine-8-amino-7-oxononanoate aminotransferase